MSDLDIGRRRALALGGAVLLSGCAWQATGQTRTTFESLEIVTRAGRHRFKVEIADEGPERNRGLMHRRSLAADRGMLFIFPDERPVAFWMRNTLIPLDMIFVRRNGTIRSIAHQTRPLDETPVPSGGPVLAVLEIAGGRARQLGVLPGDRIVHRAFPRG
ncbi:DUF192 domain-containing protein [Phenylobacterium sp.]|uniref:DUF192 domain-containing protein n=1 Tax=Phenylobacterium sp. TaxID=1871053 RepID=UPI002E33A983|nr:DUF192 domain-containing protein [Phenylobacterium sp.]HEX2561252.1 DUF192 domain-containing protein [Phenylobacterium sp.]